MKESEVKVIVEYFGGDIMKLQTVLERFNAAKLDKSKEIYVLKEEILLLMIEEWTKYQNKQMQVFANLSSFETYNEY